MKKLFSLVALAGMFMLMSFSNIDNSVEEQIYPDCFAMADQAERISGSHNDALWDFIYDMCLFYE